MTSQSATTRLLHPYAANNAPVPLSCGTYTLLRSAQRGFTLLELLVVLVIVGLLAGIVGPNLFKHVTQSEITTAKAQMNMLSKALDTYRLDTGHYPGSDVGLTALMQAPSSEPRWRGPYLREDLPRDPWGTPYQYRAPGNNGHDFELTSLGKDGRLGGSDENADITVW